MREFFSNKESSREGIVSAVALRIVKWASVRKEFSYLKIGNILHNWNTCLRLVSQTEKESILGSSSDSCLRV